MNSIYTNADPTLLKLFELAGDLRKVLCAPLDFAKKSHMALFCNGLGDILKRPFHVANSPAGVKKLLQEVAATCRHRAISSKHVFFGGEDLPSYAENFLAQLRGQGFLVARVNAFDAKKQREKLQASTDELDLHGIAHCLLKGRARVLTRQPEVQQQLRVLVREREFLVHHLTAVRNRLYPHVDRLFPGFMDHAKSGIHPHGPACYWLLENRFSAPQIARRNLESLVAGLRKHRVAKAEEVAEELRAYAASTLPPEKELVWVSQFSLEQLLQVEKALSQCLRDLAAPMARVLWQTPAARLTTVPGLALTLSAGLGAEIGLLREIPSLARLCSYAGIIAATEQTGGPDKEPWHRSTYPHCNTRLKNYLLQAGEHMARISGSDAQTLRTRAEAGGQHTLRVLGKHAASVVRALLLGERAYLPSRLYRAPSQPEERGLYWEQYWPKLCAKWRAAAPLSQVFDPAQPLGRWRRMAQEAYGISLPLPGSPPEKEQNQPKEPGQNQSEAALEEALS